MNHDYINFKDNLTKCFNCCFRDPKEHPLVPNYIPPPVKLFFIGENPSHARGQKIPFDEGTKSGKALDKNYLLPLGLNRNEIWITDLFKCRYPIRIYHNKIKFEKVILDTARKCKYWLEQEIEMADPKIIVTLSDTQVYQRFRIIFNLDISDNFKEVVGNKYDILINNKSRMLFPMVHPDTSRLLEVRDKWKEEARRKWAPKHRDEHIPKLKEILKQIKN